MKRHMLKIAAAVGVVFALAGCYEDKGNYDYHDVNTVTITIPETRVRMPKTDPVEVTITPTIDQTLAKQEANLSFQWLVTKEDAKAGSDRMSDYQAFSTGKECKLTIEPFQTENVGLLLVVTDKTDGTTWYKKGQVNIIKPFNPCWFVLQEKDEKGLLGAVEGTPDGFYLYPDVFKSEQNAAFPLAGKPLALSARKEYGNKDAASLFGFFGFTLKPALVIATSQDVALLEPSTITVKYPGEKILFEPIAQGKSIQLQQYKMDRHGELFVNAGKAFFAYMDCACIPYSLKEGDNFPSISAFGSGKNVSYFFDKGNHRFLKLSSLSTGDFMGKPRNSVFMRRYGRPWSDSPTRLKPVGQRGTYENVFDPDHIATDLDVKDIVCGGSFGNNVYAIAAPAGGNRLTVFKFSCRSEEPFCAARFTVDLPDGVDPAVARFAASYAYTNNFIFMAAGAKVYRIDLDRQRVNEIYHYDESAGASVSCLKFKNPEKSDDLGTTLGIGVNAGDKGFVVELRLTPAGDVVRDNGVCVYKDAAQAFGKIVDITYNYE